MEEHFDLEQWLLSFQTSTNDNFDIPISDFNDLNEKQNNEESESNDNKRVKTEYPKQNNFDDFFKPVYFKSKTEKVRIINMRILQ